MLIEAVGGGEGVDAVALDQALWRLTAEEREIITPRHLDGLSYVQLAERLTVPLGTVMSRLYYARRRLRSVLETNEPATRKETN